MKTPSRTRIAKTTFIKIVKFRLTTLTQVKNNTLNTWRITRMTSTLISYCINHLKSTYRALRGITFEIIKV